MVAPSQELSRILAGLASQLDPVDGLPLDRLCECYPGWLCSALGLPRAGPAFAVKTGLARLNSGAALPSLSASIASVRDLAKAAHLLITPPSSSFTCSNDIAFLSTFQSRVPREILGRIFGLAQRSTTSCGERQRPNNAISATCRELHIVFRPIHHSEVHITSAFELQSLHRLLETKSPRLQSVRTLSLAFDITGTLPSHLLRR